MSREHHNTPIKPYVDNRGRLILHMDNQQTKLDQCVVLTRENAVVLQQYLHDYVTVACQYREQREGAVTLAAACLSVGV